MSALRVTRIKVDQAGVRRMLGTRFMVREMERRAELVRLLAIQLSPVLTGLYIASHTVDSGVNARGAAFGRVSNNATSPEGAPYGFFLEVGTRHMRAQRILRRALRAAED